MLESLSNVRQLHQVRKLWLIMNRSVELLPECLPLNDVPFEGKNIDLGGLDHLLFMGGLVQVFGVIVGSGDAC